MSNLDNYGKIIEIGNTVKEIDSSTDFEDNSIDFIVKSIGSGTILIKPKEGHIYYVKINSNLVIVQ